MRDGTNNLSLGGNIDLVRDGEVARLRLNRPEKRNAIGHAMWAQLPGLVSQVEADPVIKVLVLEAADGADFCAGLDLADLEEAAAQPERLRPLTAAMTSACGALRAVSKPTVASIRGLCTGGGLVLAMCCDLRFATETARFGISAARIGLLPHFSEISALVSLIGAANAADLMFSGRLMQASEAERIGLVHDVWRDDSFAAATGEYVAALCSASQYSIRGAKAMLRAIALGATEETPRLRALYEQAMTGEDFREGAAALREKRAPQFTWR